MPKKAKEWGALEVKRIEHSGTRDRNEWYAVGGVAGLLLQVSPGGAKSWLLRTMIGGARRSIGLGGFPEVGLAAARDKAREAKAKIEAGVDPIEEKKAARAALVAARQRALLFEQATDRWIAAMLAERTEKSRKAVRASIARHAFPELGKLLVADIQPKDVVRALKPIWGEKIDAARKLRGYIEAILQWATQSGYRSGDNPARWLALKGTLAPHSKIAKGKTTHQPAVKIAELPGWWAELQTCGGMGADALRFAVLTAARSGEVRAAEWREIDEKAGMWIIPGAKMKAGADHRVPLSADAVALLKGLPRADDQPLVFWAPRGGMLSDMTVSKVMRDMQERAEKAAAKAEEDPAKAGWRDELSDRPAVPHGLRSSFRDWCADTGVERELAEIALAHKVGSEAERAYRRSDMVERRRAVMTKWADYLAGRDAGVVVAFPASAQNGG